MYIALNFAPTHAAHAELRQQVVAGDREAERRPLDPAVAEQLAGREE